MQNRQKGSMAEPILILIGLLIIMFLFVLPATGVFGPPTSRTVFGPLSISSTNGTSNTQTGQGVSTGPALSTTSAYAHLLTLGTGNASYAVDPAEEYITINNSGTVPIDITGWKLGNDRANRTYYSGNQELHYASETALIPQGASYISPSGLSFLQDIVLDPGDTAIVTTGTDAVQSPYKIVSFKENECTGYIESLPQYDFTPSLSYMCVSAQNEPGYGSLDRACKDFVASISSCRTPTYGKVSSYSNDNCSNCVNGQPAPSSACLNYIKDHFSYQGCINYHANDKDFYGNTWRIFLGQKWELWGQQDEVISLFDKNGRLAAYRAY